MTDPYEGILLTELMYMPLDRLCEILESKTRSKNNADNGDSDISQNNSEVKTDGREQGCGD